MTARATGRRRTTAGWKTVKFDQPVQQIVFQEYVDTVKAMTKRVAALDKQIESAAAESVFWPVIEGLMALRGVNLLTATTIVAEIGDLRRFASAPQLMAYLGVVPSEHSSGGTKSRGGITKTGNGHVRRVLVEAAWTYRHPASKTAVLQRRAERTSEAVQEIAWKAQKRLCARYRLLEARGKLKVQVVHGHRPRTGRLHLGDWAGVAAASGQGIRSNDHERAVCRQQNGQRWENPRARYEASGNGMTLDTRARQLPDESVVMR